MAEFDHIQHKIIQNNEKGAIPQWKVQIMKLNIQEGNIN